MILLATSQMEEQSELHSNNNNNKKPRRNNNPEKPSLDHNKPWGLGRLYAHVPTQKQLKLDMGQIENIFKLHTDPSTKGRGPTGTRGLSATSNQILAVK